MPPISDRFQSVEIVTVLPTNCSTKVQIPKDFGEILPGFLPMLFNPPNLPRFVNVLSQHETVNLPLVPVPELLPIPC